jgi:hypothetical protein
MKGVSSLLGSSARVRYGTFPALELIAKSHNQTSPQSFGPDPTGLQRVYIGEYGAPMNQVWCGMAQSLSCALKTGDSNRS